MVCAVQRLNYHNPANEPSEEPWAMSQQPGINPSRPKKNFPCHMIVLIDDCKKGEGKLKGLVSIRHKAHEKLLAYHSPFSPCLRC